MHNTVQVYNSKMENTQLLKNNCMPSYFQTAHKQGTGFKLTLTTSVAK